MTSPHRPPRAVLSDLIRRRWPIPVAGLFVAVAIVGASLMASGADGESLVVYNGRSHYGSEKVFRDFEQETGIKVTLRGGTGPELFTRLQKEGDDTPADLLVTTDLANLWRAKAAGLLQAVDTPALRENVPAGLHDHDDQWWAITTRVRVPVVSTARVPAGAVDSYEDLGDPQWRGRTCLRTSANEYNQSLVADMLAKRGREATEALLRSWMANDPDIINSDGEMLGAIKAGGCDVGLSNHYYLARLLKDDPSTPIAPAWPDQDGAGAHANVSGVGVVRSSGNVDAAVQLMEYLTSPPAQREIVDSSGGEFAANPKVAPSDHIASWAGIVMDPIDVAGAGPLLGDALELMLEVGWR